MKSRFQILESVAQGGFSLVSRARDAQTGNVVALKEARADVRGSREQLEREAETTALLPPHPGIAQVVASGSDWLAREWVEGETLEARLARGPLSESEGASVLNQLLSILRSIHRAGFAHGDVNESNVILTDQGIKLIDLGSSVELDSAKQHLTGSVFHMAPELFDNEPASEDTDLYAAGVLAYRAVTGRFPFDGDTKLQVITAHHRFKPVPLDGDLGERIMSLLRRTLLMILCLLSIAAQAQTNLNEVLCILTVPHVVSAAPSAGKRVVATTLNWSGTDVHHALYLPEDWKPGGTYPVIVEYAGNGGYKNKLGDVSEGTVEGCAMGYGLSAGRGFIWISMPFVETDGTAKRNATKWWGSVAETKRYCLATVRDVCQRFGGDASRVVLMGFSRGAIACNYIGLHDDEIAQLWCGMICHSHYEGEFKHPAADNDAWPERLRRLRKPQFISQEGSTQKTQDAIASVGVEGSFTFAALPFANHSVRWTLCDLPLRNQAREWLLKLVKSNQVNLR